MNIDLLVQRIIVAIKNNEKITIFGDCDYDGLVSGVILYRFLSEFTSNIDLKYVERSIGHGTEFVYDQIDEETKLYIAVDSSSNDIEPLKNLLSRGIDCLVIDHHEVLVNNPFAITVNPQQEGCNYPNKNASGGLLVWKVCKTIDDYMDTNYADQYVDLAGFAVAADMMSMIEPENRYYFSNSLKNVKHIGLRLLFKKMNANLNNLYANDFLYKVSPCVSAATRSDNIQLAIDFLLETDEQRAKKYVTLLVKENEKRKKLQQEALNRLKPTFNLNDKCIVVYDPTIGKGYNGLVAQEISKLYNRPAIVLGNSDDPEYYAGSYRGLDDFSMMKILESCEYAEYAVGHPGAGGTKVKISNLENLIDELNLKLENQTIDDSIYYDLTFDVSEINERLINKIEDFYRVTGEGFKQGTFRIVNLFVSTRKLKGKSENTVEVDCGLMKLMKFKTDSTYLDTFPVFSFIEAVGSLNMNYWTQYKPKYTVLKTCQLLLDDYREVNQTN